MKRYLAPTLKQHISNEDVAAAVSHMGAASCGEVAACLVRVPAEVIKQRTQTSKGSSSLQTFQALWRNQRGEGLRGFYRGWSTTIMREIPFTVIQFPLYEWLKKRWSTSQGQQVNPLQGALCGSIAGGFAAAVTTPLDLLKTRIMLSDQRVGPLALAKTILREEGFKVFFSGVGPRTMWISAGGAIFLGVYEAVSTTWRSLDPAPLA